MFINRSLGGSRSTKTDGVSQFAMIFSVPERKQGYVLFRGLRMFKEDHRLWIESGTLSLQSAGLPKLFLGCMRCVCRSVELHYGEEHRRSSLWHWKWIGTGWVEWCHDQARTWHPHRTCRNGNRSTCLPCCGHLSELLLRSSNQRHIASVGASLYYSVRPWSNPKQRRIGSGIETEITNETSWSKVGAEW